MSRFPPIDDARLPVSLLTGFLGSGKTTLLNRLLGHPQMARTAVLINELGAVLLDQLFVQASDGDVAVLSNGCLCCDVRGDLPELIGTLYGRRDRGDIPAFDRMLIETTGLADPAPIMQMLLNQPLIADNFRLDAVVTTVDALHVFRQLAEHPEAVDQIALADRLVLTKTDLLAEHGAPGNALEGAAGWEPAEGRAAIASRLRALNPQAPVLMADRVVPAELFGIDPAASVHASRAHAEPPHAHAHGHLRGVEAVCFICEQPLVWRDFWAALTAFKIRYAEQLLRAKALLDVAGETAPVVVQGVHHVFHPPARLPAWPRGQRDSRMVLITRDLPRDEIEAYWQGQAGSWKAVGEPAVTSGVDEHERRAVADP